MKKAVTKEVAAEVVSLASGTAAVQFCTTCIQHGLGNASAQVLLAGGLAGVVGVAAAPLAFVSVAAWRAYKQGKGDAEIREELKHIRGLVERQNTDELEKLLDGETLLKTKILDGDIEAIADLTGQRVVTWLQSVLHAEISNLDEETARGIRIYFDAAIRMLEAIKGDTEAILKGQESQATSAEVAAVSTQVEELKRMFLEQASPPEQPRGDSTSERDFVNGLKRVLSDSERGVQSAQRIAEGATPSELIQYLEDRRTETERVRMEAQARSAQELIELDREISATAFLVGDIERASNAVERLLAADPDDIDAINRKGHIHRTRGELDDAIAAYERALSIAADSGHVKAAVFGNIGIVLHTRGDTTGAEAMFHKSLNLYQRLRNVEGMADQYGNFSILFHNCGDIDGAEAMSRKALALHVQVGNILGVASQYSCLGNILFTKGVLDEAETMYRKALEFYQRLGSAAGTASQYACLGNVVYSRGEIDNAEDMYRKALELDERLGRIESMANQYSSLGNVHFSRKEFDRAEFMYRKALALNERLGSVEGMAGNYGNLGNILAVHGDIEGAERMQRRALKLDELIGNIEGMAANHRNLGIALKSRGELEATREHWLKSRDLYTQLSATKMVAEVQAMLDTLPPT